MTLCTRSKRLLALLLLIRRKKKYTLKKTRLWVHSMNRTFLLYMWHSYKFPNFCHTVLASSRLQLLAVLPYLKKYL